MYTYLDHARHSKVHDGVPPLARQCHPEPTVSECRYSSSLLALALAARDCPSAQLGSLLSACTTTLRQRATHKLLMVRALEHDPVVGRLDVTDHAAGTRLGDQAARALDLCAVS